LLALVLFVVAILFIDFLYDDPQAIFLPTISILLVAIFFQADSDSIPGSCSHVIPFTVRSVRKSFVGCIKVRRKDYHKRLSIFSAPGTGEIYLISVLISIDFLFKFELRIEVNI
tara:strand:- start:197 stop:538 length:342 start_codon:yes stop_codon:yes gene_type:complete